MPIWCTAGDEDHVSCALSSARSRPACSNADARQLPNRLGVSSSSSEIQPATSPCAFTPHTTSANTVVLPKPAGARNTVSRRSSNPSMWCSSDARRTYPAGGSGASTFAFGSQDGTTLHAET